MVSGSQGGVSCGCVCEFVCGSCRPRTLWVLLALACSIGPTNSIARTNYASFFDKLQLVTELPLSNSPNTRPPTPKSWLVQCFSQLFCYVLTLVYHYASGSDVLYLVWRDSDKQNPVKRRSLHGQNSIRIKLVAVNAFVQTILGSNMTKLSVRSNDNGNCTAFCTSHVCRETKGCFFHWCDDACGFL